MLASKGPGRARWAQLQCALGCDEGLGLPVRRRLQRTRLLSTGARENDIWCDILCCLLSGVYGDSVLHVCSSERSSVMGALSALCICWVYDVHFMCCACIAHHHVLRISFSLYLPSHHLLSQECPSLADPLGGFGNEAGRDCSGRGHCDYQTGLCKCFGGFHGAACNKQSVTF